MHDHVDRDRRGLIRGSIAAVLGAIVSAGAPLAASALDATNTDDNPVSARSSIAIVRPGSQVAATGSPANFSGDVIVDSRFRGTGRATVSGGIVSFQAGARTAWHTHPLGQTLYVISGSGFVRQAGSDRQEMRPGDIVWIPPGVRHWHGASLDTPMSHLGFSEAVDGKSVDWLELVSDDEYRR